MDVTLSHDDESDVSMIDPLLLPGPSTVSLSAAARPEASLPADHEMLDILQDSLKAIQAINPVGYEDLLHITAQNTADAAEVMYESFQSIICQQPASRFPLGANAQNVNVNALNASECVVEVYVFYFTC